MNMKKLFLLNLPYLLFVYCSGARSLANRARSVSNITPA